jgi:hypothetical protein
VDSFEYQRLREIECGDFAFQREADCIWLDRPKPPPVAAAPRATRPLVHSGLARVGVATAVAPLR